MSWPLSLCSIHRNSPVERLYARVRSCLYTLVYGIVQSIGPLSCCPRSIKYTKAFFCAWIDLAYSPSPFLSARLISAQIGQRPLPILSRQKKPDLFIPTL